jgi:uncharacterized protein YcbX
MHTIVALLRYPVKSLRGETLKSADLDPAGVRGDRGWACADAGESTGSHAGSVGSAKLPRRWGRLLELSATLDSDSNGDGGGGGVPVLRIGGATVHAGTGEADAALSAHLGRPVRLTRRLAAGAQLHRVLPDDPGMVPEWMATVGAGNETAAAFTGSEHDGRFVDFGAVHLVTTGALARLGRQAGTAVDPARFRPNLVLDAPEDPEPGQELRVGDAVLRVLTPTPRCVIPGLSHGPLPSDRPLLSILARHHRRQVADFGRAACFGMYAEVVQPGRLSVGDRVNAA